MAICDMQKSTFGLLAGSGMINNNNNTFTISDDTSENTREDGGTINS